MATAAVPVKTQLGLDELRGRARTLGQRHRTVLVLVDGRRALSEVLSLAQQAGAQTSHFEDLVRMGMVELPGAAMAPDPPRESVQAGTDLVRVTSVELEVPAEPPAKAAQPEAVRTAELPSHEAARTAESRLRTRPDHEGVPGIGVDGAAPVSEPQLAERESRVAAANLSEDAPSRASSEPVPIRKPETARLALPNVPRASISQPRPPPARAAPESRNADAVRDPPGLRAASTPPSPGAPAQEDIDVSPRIVQPGSGIAPRQQPPARAQKVAAAAPRARAEAQVITREPAPPTPRPSRPTPAAAAPVVPTTALPQKLPPAVPIRRSLLGRLAAPRSAAAEFADEPEGKKIDRVRALLVETLRIDAPLFGVRMLVRLRAAETADDLIELVWAIERHLLDARHSRDEMISLQRARELLGLGNTVVADDD
jgi:hypothetical protein